MIAAMPADLASNLAARLHACSSAELQLIDRALGTLEGVRGGDALGRRWERRIATGAHDVDRSWHMARRSMASTTVDTPCNGSWWAGDAFERRHNPPLDERCTACWREAVQGDPLGLALIAAVVEIHDEERARAEKHERARDEVVPRPVVCRRCDRPADSEAIAHEKWWSKDADGWTCVGCNGPAPVVQVAIPGENMDRIVVDEPDSALDVDPRDIGAGEGT